MNKKVLQVHTRGDARFSPFSCYIESFGQIRSIEDHYQCTKRFDVFDSEIGNWEVVQAKDWREAKELQNWKKKGGDIELLGFWLPNGFFLGDSNDKVTDLVIQYYIGLWYKYIKRNAYLVEIAREYDDFLDIFKGSFPFSQEEVWRKVAKEGVESLKPMFSELVKKLREYELTTAV